MNPNAVTAPMKSLADSLPPEIAQQLHPDWRKNEADYWSARDALLSQYGDRWIAFADGAVIATASNPLDVFLAIHNSGRHPFVIRVGHEDEPWHRIRRTGDARPPKPPWRRRDRFRGRSIDRVVRRIGRHRLSRTARA